MRYGTSIAFPGAALLLAPALLLATPAAAQAASDPGYPLSPPAALLVALGLVHWLLLAALALWAGAAAVRLLLRPNGGEPAGGRSADRSGRLSALTRTALIAVLVAAPAEALLRALLPALPAGLSFGAALGSLAGLSGALALLRWLLAGAGLLLARRWPWLAAGLAAVALGLTAWLGALPPQAPAGPPLVLADSADDLLIQFAYTPGRFRVDLSDALAKPVRAAAVAVHLVPLSGQGGEQRLALAPGMQGLTFAKGLGSVAYTAPGMLPAGGRWRIEVSVSRPGRPVATTAFELTSAEPGGGAQPLLALADAAMSRLKSMRQREWLGYGENTLVTDFEFAAPDRMHFKTSGDFERVAIGKSMWDRDKKLSWTRGPWPGLKPFAFPDWSYAPEAVNATLLDTESVDGHPCYVVAFLHRSSGARFRMWIDQQSYLVRQSVMMAPGHFMRDTYTGFDEPVQIEAPAP